MQAAQQLEETLNQARYRQAAKWFPKGDDPLWQWIVRVMKDQPVEWMVHWEALGSAGLLSLRAVDEDGEYQSFGDHLCRYDGGFHAIDPFAQSVEVVHHDLDVTLFPDQGGIWVTDQLTLSGAGEIYLQLDADWLLQDCDVPFYKAGHFLCLALAKSGEQTVRLRYGGILRHREDYVAPDGCLMRDSALWYPHLFDGQRFCRHRLRVVTPQGWEMAAVGDLKARESQAGETVWIWDCAVPTNGITFGGGRLTAHTLGDVTALLKPERASLAPQVLDEAMAIRAFFADVLDPYPWPHLWVVQGGGEGGYGADGVALLEEECFEAPEPDWELMAHEVAHSWTGRLGLAGKRGETGFIAEGLASYLAAHYLEVSRGHGRFLESLQAMFGRVAGVQDDVPLVEIEEGDPAWEVLAYDKAALVFHQLRLWLGDERFWSAIRAFFHQGVGKRTGVRELATAAGEPWFFEQWLGQAGLPQLKLSGVKVAHGKVQGVIQQIHGNFRLKVPVAIEGPMGQERHAVTVKGGRTPFALPYSGDVSRLVLDPDGEVLMKRLVAPTLDAFGGSRRGVLLIYGTGGWGEEKRLARLSALEVSRYFKEKGQTAEVVADVEADEELLAGAGDVSVFGRPGVNRVAERWRERWPVAFEAKGFRYGGQAYGKPSQGVICTIPHPLGEGIVTLYAAVGAKGAEKINRIRHGWAPVHVFDRDQGEWPLLSGGQRPQDPDHVWTP